MISRINLALPFLLAFPFLSNLAFLTLPSFTASATFIVTVVVVTILWRLIRTIGWSCRRLTTFTLSTLPFGFAFSFRFAFLFASYSSTVAAAIIATIRCVASGGSFLSRGGSVPLFRACGGFYRLTRGRLSSFFFL